MNQKERLSITITKEVHPNVDISDIENKTKYKPKK